jgi:hypothetical protein
VTDNNNPLNFDPSEFLGALGSGPTEPSADLRSAATTLFELFQSFKGAGFSDDQALQLIASVLAASAVGRGPE